MLESHPASAPSAVTMMTVPYDKDEAATHLAFAATGNCSADEDFFRSASTALAYGSSTMDSSPLPSAPSQLLKPRVTGTRPLRNQAVLVSRKPQEASVYATKDDWIRHSALVQDLYHRHKLSDIIKIMDSQHGFKATSVTPTPSFATSITDCS